MIHSWLVLLPPLIILIGTLITQQLNPSLFLGICVAALIGAHGSPIAAIELLFKRVGGQLTDPDIYYLCAFLIILGSFIVVLSYTGGATAFARAMTRHLKTARMVEGASLLVSSALFIDDYLSNLTVGYVIRPLTDRFKIPRAKLAYLVHSLSGPLVILVPISSWTAMITSTMSDSDVAAQATSTTKILIDPFSLYLHAIPFIFYSLLTIISAWVIVSFRISFGPMYTHEVIAQTTGNLLGGKEEPITQASPPASTRSSVADLLIPLIVLVASVVIGIAYAGGFHWFGGDASFAQALRNNTQTSLILVVAGSLTLLVSLFMAYRKKQITCGDTPSLFMQGFELMRFSMIMLFLARILSVFLKYDLGTGQYLADTILHNMPSFLLPCMFFIVATITALITGTAWGTIALLVPIALEMIASLATGTAPFLPSNLPLVYPILGAIYSGAVCGNHVSPIAETTIMAATSAGSYPIDHAYTQAPYAAPAVIGAASAFIASGVFAHIHYTLTANVLCSLSIGLAVCISLLCILNRFMKKS